MNYTVGDGERAEIKAHITPVPVLGNNANDEKILCSSAYCITLLKMNMLLQNFHPYRDPDWNTKEQFNQGKA